MDRRAAAFGQGGFTLIEVLVTIVVLSIGLLGIAALQASTIRGTQSAYFRSQAATLGQQIADAMRANHGAAMNNCYDIAFDGSPPCGGVAQSDLNNWQSALAARLPSGQGSVSVGGNDVATVCIRWAVPQRRQEEQISVSSDSCGTPATGTRQFEFQTVL